MKPTRMLIMAATVVATIGVAAFIWTPKPLKATLDYEVFKLTYQFLLIVVVGGAVSLLYKRLETERDDAAKHRDREATRREGERNVQRELRTDLVRAYHSAKKIRRLLRAKAAEYIPGTVTTIIRPGSYYEQMELLIDTQLDFEFFVDRVRSNLILFSAAPDLLQQLQTLENYLSEIITEYEGSASLFTQHQGAVPLSSLKRLQDFIGPYAATSFKSDFKVPFLNAIARLETLITRV